MKVLQDDLPHEQAAQGEQVKGFPLALPQRGWRRWAKFSLGAIMLRLHSDLVTRFEAGLPPRNRLEQLALAVLAIRYREAGCFNRLARQHHEFWLRGPCDFVYDATGPRLEKQLFNGPHRIALDRLEAELEQGSFHTVCEIGCGNGAVLAYLADRLPAVDRFIGLDLNAAQIARNQVQHAADTRLEFSACDAIDWITHHAGPNMAFYTYGGVFEYFTQSQLEGMLLTLAMHTPTCIALVEPVSFDHDFEADSTSQPHGRELSYSHAYPALLAKAGFQGIWQAESADAKSRWMMLLARPPPPA